MEKTAVEFHFFLIKFWQNCLIYGLSSLTSNSKLRCIRKLARMRKLLTTEDRNSLLWPQRLGVPFEKPIQKEFPRLIYPRSSAKKATSRILLCFPRASALKIHAWWEEASKDEMVLFTYSGRSSNQQRNLSMKNWDRTSALGKLIICTFTKQWMKMIKWLNAIRLILFCFKNV